jgi:ubiquinone/menaquinone biosynthesis C-methylase UbiE
LLRVSRKTKTDNQTQDHFDFIHFRLVVQGITKWPQVLGEAYRCLKPGAYVELAEGDSKFVDFVLHHPERYLSLYKHIAKAMMVP